MTDRPSPENPICIKCGLFINCKSPFMQADVHENDAVLFCGEAPGETEDKEGKPFVGVSGQYLKNIVTELGVPLGFTNAVRCRPVDNATPTTKQINACKEFMLQDIRDSSAKVIVLLGNTALKAATGYSGITNWRGKVLSKEDKSLIATYHPAALLYEQGNSSEVVLEGQFLEDMGRIVELLEGTANTGDDAGFEYVLVDTLDKARRMFEDLKTAGKCGYDLEFINLRAYTPGNVILMASFATRNPDRGYALPLFHKQSPFNEDELNELLDLFDDFCSESVAKIGHNIKIDCLIPLATLGIRVANVVGDTLIISQLVDSRHGIHDLKQLAGKYLGMYDYDAPLKAYVSEHPEADYTKNGDYSAIPLDVLWPYAAKDAAATLLIEPILLDKLDEKQKILYYNVLVPAISTFTRIEANGCSIDVELIKSYRTIYETENDKLLEELRKHPKVIELEEGLNATNKSKKQYVETGLDRTNPNWIKYNPNSSDQTRKIVYEGLGFTPIVYSEKTNKPSTAAAALKWFKHTWLDAYRNYKLYASALSKYLYPMPTWIGVDGRIRSSYNLIGTDTGRTSSSDPNLQNIPTPEKQPGTLLETYPIKNAFIHTWEGGCLMAVDYSAMELRMMAATSKSALMSRMFIEHKDPHTFVASKLYGIPEEEITKPQRYRAKWVNWTMLYGGGWTTLSSTYGLSESEAKELESGWMALFPEIAVFYKEQVKFAKKNGYSVSLLGKRKYVPAISLPIKTKKDRSLVLRAEREAANHPIQSVASDLLIMAIVIIDNIMQSHGMKSLIINTVHDSILFDIYPGELEKLHHLCIDVMQNLPEYARDYFPDIDLSWLTIPLVVDVEVGERYGSMKELETEKV